MRRVTFTYPTHKCATRALPAQVETEQLEKGKDDQAKIDTENTQDVKAEIATGEANDGTDGGGVVKDAGAAAPVTPSPKEAPAVVELTETETLPTVTPAVPLFKMAVALVEKCLWKDQVRHRGYSKAAQRELCRCYAAQFSIIDLLNNTHDYYGVDQAFANIALQLYVVVSQHSRLKHAEPRL